LGALIVLVVTALWRVRLNIRYETWHLTHIGLAIVAVTGGLLHMVGWSFYLADPWKRALWIGLTVFWIGLLLYVRIATDRGVARRTHARRGGRGGYSIAITISVLVPDAGVPGVFVLFFERCGGSFDPFTGCDPIYERFRQATY